MTLFQLGRRAAVAGALSAVLASPAVAADARQGELPVDYSDLDLSSKPGIHTLRHRLVTASRVVCGPPGAANPLEAAQVDACQSDALQDALHSLRTVLAAARARRPDVVASAGIH